jgi:hypothetical protein
MNLHVLFYANVFFYSLCAVMRLRFCMYFYLSIRSSLVSNYNCRFSYCLYLNTLSQSLKCFFIILTSSMLQIPSNQSDFSNRLRLQNVVILSHFHKIFLVIPSGVSILKVSFCSEYRGIMFFWSTGTYLPNCTSWHSIRPYFNIHCFEILNCHIFFSKLNTADYVIQINSSFADRIGIYADILLE